jgi:phosphohistidine phosphatase SixA
MRAGLLGCCLCLLVAVQGCGGGAGDGARPGVGGEVDKGAQALPAVGTDGTAPKSGTGRVFVARHCQYGRGDGRLTEEGRAQAAAMAVKLKDKHIDVILHSPIVRCEETARIIRESLGGKPRIESADWLHEDSKLGKDWRGQLPEGNILLITHSPVIRQLTSAEKASSHGEVTEVKKAGFVTADTRRYTQRGLGLGMRGCNGN